MSMLPQYSQGVGDTHSAEGKRGTFLGHPHLLNLYHALQTQSEGLVSPLMIRWAVRVHR